MGPPSENYERQTLHFLHYGGFFMQHFVSFFCNLIDGLWNYRHIILLCRLFMVKLSHIALYWPPLATKTGSKTSASKASNAKTVYTRGTTTCGVKEAQICHLLV